MEEHAFFGLKNKEIEPQVFAILVTSTQGNLLHLGVHYSLEEAYFTARERLFNISKNKNLPVEIDLWNSAPLKNLVKQGKGETIEVLTTLNSTDSVSPPSVEVISVTPGQIPQAILDKIVELSSQNTEKIIGTKDSSNKKEKEYTLEEQAELIREAKNIFIKNLVEAKIEPEKIPQDILNNNEKTFISKKVSQKIKNNRKSNTKI